MTCIVGLEVYGSVPGVMLGADSLQQQGYLVRVLSEQAGKLITRDPLIIGVAGDASWAGALRYRWDMPEPILGETPFAYLAGRVGPSMRAFARSEGLLQVKDGIERLETSELLIGYGGHLYAMSRGFTIMEQGLGYWAIGTGAEVALGSLYSTEADIYDHDLDPSVAGTRARQRVSKALHAAGKFISTVRQPFVIKWQAQ